MINKDQVVYLKKNKPHNTGMFDIPYKLVDYQTTIKTKRDKTK